MNKLEFNEDGSIKVPEFEIKIDEKFKEKYDEVPWQKIAGMRDVIAHGYFMVDLNAVWKIFEKDLPNLKEKILKIKKDWQEGKIKPY